MIPSPANLVFAVSFVFRVSFFFVRLHRSHLTPQRTSQCNRAASVCTGREIQSSPPVDRQRSLELSNCDANRLVVIFFVSAHYLESATLVSLSGL
jgi:hypothetical protein